MTETSLFFCSIHSSRKNKIKIKIISIFDIDYLYRDDLMTETSIFFCGIHSSRKNG